MQIALIDLAGNALIGANLTMAPDSKVPVEVVGVNGPITVFPTKLGPFASVAGVLNGTAVGMIETSVPVSNDPVVNSELTYTATLEWPGAAGFVTATVFVDDIADDGVLWIGPSFVAGMVEPGEVVSPAISKTDFTTLQADVEAMSTSNLDSVGTTGRVLMEAETPTDANTALGLVVALAAKADKAATTAALGTKADQAAMTALGKFSTATLSADLAYETSRYSLLQWTAMTSGVLYGGLAVPAASSAWVRPGAGRWKVTLSLAFPTFSSPTAACYVYLLHNVAAGTPYTIASFPSYENQLRLQPVPGGGGTEVSAEVTLGAGDSVSAMLYQASGASISLQGWSLTTPSWNSLRFCRLG